MAQESVGMEKRKIPASLIQLIEHQNEPIAIKGCIESTDPTSNTFYLKTDKNEYIECYYDEINHYQKGDSIIMKGKYAINEDCRIYLNVEFMCGLDDGKKINALAKNYQKIKNTLNDPKFRPRIQKIHNLRIPKNVLNVGVITFSGNDDNINNFKIAFQEKCIGNLYIYRAESDNLLSFETGLEYFKKYHEIDLVCFLINQIDLYQIYDLSSIGIVKYLINRKNYPYIISITPTKEKLNPIPFSVSLSNKNVEGIFECVDFVHKIQVDFRKKIDLMMADGVLQLKQIINQRKSRLLECKLLMAELMPSSKIQKPINIPMEKLKVLLLNRISKEKSKMIKLATQLSTNFIYDDHIKEIIDGVTDGKIVTNSKNTDVHDEIGKSHDRKKEIAFRQNPYFQTFPGLIVNAIGDFDEIVSEISQLNPEKIEIKISSDITSDTLDNIIDSNGDF